MSKEKCDEYGLLLETAKAMNENARPHIQLHIHVAIDLLEKYLDREKHLERIKAAYEAVLSQKEIDECPDFGAYVDGHCEDLADLITRRCVHTDLIKLAHELGWNGVDNSKLLHCFFRHYISDLQIKAGTLWLCTRRVCNGESCDYDHFSIHRTEEDAKTEAEDNITPKERKSAGDNKDYNMWDSGMRVREMEFRTGRWGCIVWNVRPLELEAPE